MPGTKPRLPSMTEAAREESEGESEGEEVGPAPNL